MDEAEQRRADRRLALLGFWVLGAILYLAWSALTETGLCYWVAAWEIDQFGHYEPAETPMGPALVLVVLPVAFAMLRARRTMRAAVHDPAREIWKLRKLTHFVGAVGAVLLLLAGFCFWRMPHAAGPGAPTPSFDVRRLQDGPPPEGRVQLDGIADPNAFAILTVDASSKSHSSSRYERYAVFHATGDTAPPGAPAHLLVNRLTGRDAPAYGLNDPTEPYRGYLVQDGLSPLARHVVESRGIRLADPYYVLLREPDPFWFDAGLTAAGLGLFGLIFAGGLAGARAQRIGGWSRWRR